MQFEILGILILALLILLGFINYRSYGRRRTNIRSRHVVDLEKVRDGYFPHYSQSEFRELWDSLASTIRIPPEKLYPEETVRSLSELYAFKEAFYDDLEDYLTSKGVSSVGNNFEEMTVIDLIGLVVTETNAE